MTVTRKPRLAVLLLGLVVASACNGDSTAPDRRFLEGTPDNAQIGLVINSLGRALTMFQLGDPDEQRQIPFGASPSVTPTGLAVRGTRALVPLGNAASVALVDLEGERIERFFTFASGNTTGAAFVDDNTFLVANLGGGHVGKAALDQTGDAITATVDVAPNPTAIVVAQNRAFVVSSNYGDSWPPVDNGIVTAIDPATMAVLEAIETGGTNPTSAALGPDGKLYVVNTGDYASDGSVTIVNVANLTAETTIPGFGPGPGTIRITDDGLAYISSSVTGTLVWNTATRTFVRGPSNPVCAPAGGFCRGAFDTNRAADGSLYQAFFGTPDLPAYVFVYAPGTYQLVDSVSAGVDAATVEIATFGD